MLSITIAGTDRTSSVQMGSVTKTDNLNQQTDTLLFKIRKYGTDTYVPSLDDEVVMAKDGTTIFGGVIVQLQEDLIASATLEYTVTCNDYSQYLKRGLVTERYENTTVGAIIDDLITNYTTDGFTTDNVVGTQAIDSISFNRLLVPDCLQKLADSLSYVWYVDYEKDIHFFPKNTEEGESLSDTSGNYIYESLEIVQDLTQIRNSVLVQGGTATSEYMRTELFDGDGTKVQFPLTNKFATLPTVEVGGVAVTVGVENIDDETLFQCMWDFNQKSIRFTTGNTPVAGANNISVSGYYLYPIVVSVPAASSISEYGTYPYAITDDSITSQSEAISRALAELTSYQTELYNGQFRTYEDGFRSGQVINISSDLRDKDIDVLIQSVRATMRDPLGASLEYLVTFATLKNIGIIQYLQNQLRSEEVIVDDQESILSFAQFSDTASGADSLAVSKNSPAYYYALPISWSTLSTNGYSHWSDFGSKEWADLLSSSTVNTGYWNCATYS